MLEYYQHSVLFSLMLYWDKYIYSIYIFSRFYWLLVRWSYGAAVVFHILRLVLCSCTDVDF